MINTGADIIVKAKAEKTSGNAAVVLSSADMVITYSDNTTGYYNLNHIIPKLYITF